MTYRPRVLCACDWLVKYTAGLARGLADAGAQTMLLTRTHDFEFGNIPGASAGYVDGTVGRDVARLRLAGRPRDPRTWVEAMRLARTVGRFAPDVVHLQSTVTTDPRLVAVARVRRGRYALTLHDVKPHPGDLVEAPRQRKLESLLVRGAGLTFVHAEQLAVELRERFGDVPVAVVPHGVDPPAPEPWPDRPRLLFFGRLSHYKGLDVLLDAMPEIWRTLPELELDVAGSGALVDHAVLADPRVHVRHEHVPEAEVPAIFGRATCVVLPYREASQSGVGSVAKRFGRGMIVTEVGGLPELVADGSGLLTPPEDPGALAATILRVVREPGLAERLGRAASAGRAAGDWRRVGELTLDAYARAGLLPAGTGAPASTASNSSE